MKKLTEQEKLAGKTYAVTGFYCEICKKWHYKHEPEFHECLDKYNSHYSFNVAVVHNK